MDIDHIRNRIIEFLRSENITSAQFAQEIGVQPSGISHIISGRNKPSLDFILKMLSRYPSLSTDWLMFGKGSMFKDGPVTDLFIPKSDPGDPEFEIFPDNPAENGGKRTSSGESRPGSEPGRKEVTVTGKPATSRIVIFRTDGTFSEHFPE
ncbi:MAG TPA: helix-turn-helix transcriptional regulator [Bacteroidales bacterium]|nr:helix-turn-helix transcriptional regulator [Bacteroidales bacterium]